MADGTDIFCDAYEDFDAHHVEECFSYSIHSIPIPITNAITSLEEEGLIRVEEVGKARRHYPISQSDAERYGFESNGE